MKIKSEEAAKYEVNKDRAAEDAIIARALEILEKRMFNAGPSICSPEAAADYVNIKLKGSEREVFAVVFLSTAHTVIEYEELFLGTINAASVYPREVVKAVLRHNAAAVILVHNHPSGNAEPSAADKALTKRLSDALELIDVKVLDHLIVNAGNPYSFAAHGLI